MQYDPSPVEIIELSKHYDTSAPEPPTITLVKKTPQSYVLPAQNSTTGYASYGSPADDAGQEQQFLEESYSYSYSYSDDQITA